MKRAVILYSVGSPRELSRACIKQYLKRFLSDKLVVRMPSFLWQPILKTFILRSRPQRMLERYKQIFFDGQNPYILAMDNLASKLEQELNSQNQDLPHQNSEAFDNAQSTDAASDEFMVRIGYAYMEPSTVDAVKECLAWGAQELTILPLFPHYSDSTSKRPLLEVALLMSQNPQVKFKFVKSFGSEPVFVDAIKESIMGGLNNVVSNLKALPKINNYLHNINPFTGDKDFSLEEPVVPKIDSANINETMQKHKIHILFSMHSLPQSYIKLGDIYEKECLSSVAAIAKSLNLSDDVYSIAYQSRLGPMKWLGPYLEDEVNRLINLDKRHLIVITPGFSVDCIETLYDLNIMLRQLYINQGGESIDVLPCLNDELSHVKVLKEVILTKATEIKA